MLTIKPTHSAQIVSIVNLSILRQSGAAYSIWEKEVGELIPIDQLQHKVETGSARKDGRVYD